MAEQVGRYGVVRKGAWSEQEDSLLRQCIEKYGEGKWHQVPLRAGLNRCRKSCRLRWLNYLKPDIKRGEFSIDEADLMIRLHKLLGNRWSLIAGRLPGRTSNDVKNYWNTHLGKKTMHHHIQAKTGLNTNHAETKAIRPRPWTFSKSLVQRRTQQPQGRHMSAGKNTAVISIVDKPPAIVSAEDVEEQIQWWKSLLNETEQSSLLAEAVTSGFYSSMEEMGDDTVQDKVISYGADENVVEYKERSTDPTELSLDIELWDFLTDEWFNQQ